MIENSNDAKQEAILGEDDSEYELVSRAILPENNAGVIRNSQVEEQGSMERYFQRDKENHKANRLPTTNDNKVLKFLFSGSTYDKIITNMTPGENNYNFR